LTGPVTSEPRPDARASLGTTGMRDSARAIGTLLAAGLAFRLIIAYLLPGSGFKVDLGAFQYWANNLAQQGPNGFYERGFFADYTPGYLYVLWLMGLLGDALKSLGVHAVGAWTITDLLKLPAILADLATGYLIYRLVLDLGASKHRALVGAALFVFNPISWFDSTVWGQVDSFGVVFLLLGLRELWHDHPERAAIWATVAAVVKPQLGILVPIVAAVVIRRYLVSPRGEEPGRPGGHTAGAGLAARLGTWGARERGPTRIATTAIAGLATVVALCLPFGMSILDLLAQVARTAGGYPYLTVNAYNPWALLSQGGNGLAANGLWIRDVNGPDTGDVGFMFGPLPAVIVGTVLLLAAVAAVSWLVARRPDRLTILVGLTLLAVAFFVLPTRVHERYLYPFFALGAVLAAVSGRWRVLYVVLSIVSFLNMYVVLTTLYPDNPGISDWLGIGGDIRSMTTITIIALVHLAGFIWISGQLRRRAETQLVAEIAHGRATDPGPVGQPEAGLPEITGRDLSPGDLPRYRPVARAGAGLMRAAAALAAPAPAAATAGAADDGDWGNDPAPPPSLAGPSHPPDPAGPGLWATFRRAVLARPVRADRTRALHGEGGGSVDRLDIWMVIVLVVAAMGLRTFRLAEPYGMHFDEVYHARTATEFLQFWRYGLPHDIYEYTHPHLAKYAMAGGIVAIGDNQVTTQGSLNVPVRDAVIELRWDNPALPGAHAGDRVYVATGAEVRAYDLDSRGLIATIAAPGATTLALDQTSHRLFIGTTSGEILSVDTAAGLDPLRAHPASPTTGPPAEAFASVGAAVRDLLMPAAGSELIAALATDDIVSLDSGAGTQVAKTHLAGFRQLIEAGRSQQVVAQPTLLPDRKAAASLLAQLLGKPQADIEARLNASAATVLLGAPPTASARTTFDQAITTGTLTGVSVQSLPQVAAVSATGLTFFVPATGSVTQLVAIQGATGAAYVTGLDAPRIYVAAETKIPIVHLPNDQGSNQAAYIEATLNAPGPVERVTFDPSTNFVHVLGRTPDRSAPTIYAIEVHGNAIFADARLPFQPVAWVTDAQPLYPSQDRQDVLAFSADGGVASVDVGNNPFAWRLPGVILGALTAGLIYLLARMLFRRRSIAVIVAILVLADGMAFVQSRIGMNDVYVGFFIVAAYTLFAALWTRTIRSRSAFWLAMPTIGILLGLALASKWVGLYAVAGIGVLILARSALGRLILILGMIGATTVLGYMALTVPTGATSGGNLLFMLVMIALTIAAVLISVLHPIAWSEEEVRFAIAGPAGVGILLILVAIPLGKLNAGLVIGPVKVTGLSAGLGLVFASALVALGFWAAGRLGFGPLAPPIAPEVAGRVAPASPAPEGWLRLGSGYGIPVAWMTACLVILPIVVYVISYLPWVALGNRLLDTWPAGNHGQTLLDLTKSMYDYHNNLRAPHAASSPWWAWPFDFKPVWFYQGSFAGNTAASIYDAGNLVIWWLGIPAMAFCAWQAYRRQSLALALIVLGFAWQWLPWSRIDRATFQYHYYTSVPFIILALAYLLAELWHGASKRTWLIAKIAAGLAVVGPALLWVGKGPLCRFVRVEAVNPGSQACVGNPGDLVVTARVALLVLILGVAVVALVYQLLRLNSPGRGGGGTGGDGGEAERNPLPQGLTQIALTAVLAGIGIAVADRIAGQGVVFEVRGFQSTYLAGLLGIPLALIAMFVLTARDARRFVAGTAFAIVVAFIVLYPNISALPLPSAVVNAYQGLLPTYLYPFQFPVNTDPAAPSLKLFALEPAILLIALTITCVVVGYAAWVWRIGPLDRPTASDGSLPAAGDA
jgi:hypothetical protein